MFVCRHHHQVLKNLIEDVKEVDEYNCLKNLALKTSLSILYSVFVSTPVNKERSFDLYTDRFGSRK